MERLINLVTEKTEEELVLVPSVYPDFYQTETIITEIEKLMCRTRSSDGCRFNYMYGCLGG